MSLGSTLLGKIELFANINVPNNTTMEEETSLGMIEALDCANLLKKLFNV